MPIITFWSNTDKTIGQTVSTALAATVMAIEHNYKVLLISADTNDNMLESCFGAQESNDDIIKTLVKKPQINLGSGINGLLKLADSNRVTPELIHDYTKIVFKNRLEILYSPNGVQKAENNEIMGKIKNIILNATRYYDYIFVDLEKGFKSNAQLEILEMSDVIVQNVDQNIKTIQSALETKDIQNMMHKIIWNICKHDMKSKYNSKNILRTFLKKQAVYEIPYNTLVYDVTQEGSSRVINKIKNSKK